MTTDPFVATGSEALRTPDASSYTPDSKPAPSASASASVPTASPTDKSPTTDLLSNLGPGCTLVVDRKCLPNTIENAQCNVPVKTNEDDSGFNPYSLHFLTNCQWSFNNKTERYETERCTKPWDFVGYSLESKLLELDDEEDHDRENDSSKDDRLFRSLPLLLRRNAVNDPGSDEDDEKFEKNARKLRDSRDAFSKVHLTGCVFVGLSFLCTAISFFILPALGQWISVGNLALATLATIFLFTSSIFTAVMAKEIRSFMKNEGFSKIDTELGKTFGALV